MGKLKIIVLYDRVLVDDTEEPAGGDKAPVVRTLDKKEVEEEVAETLAKLGHEPVMHELDGTQKSLLGLAKVECDLVFNLADSFADDDSADFKIAAFLELLGKKCTGTGTNGLMRWRRIRRSRRRSSRSTASTRRRLPSAIEAGSISPTISSFPS